jgi:hypothetical protein
LRSTEQLLSSALRNILTFRSWGIRSRIQKRPSQGTSKLRGTLVKYAGQYLAYTGDCPPPKRHWNESSADDLSKLGCGSIHKPKCFCFLCSVHVPLYGEGGCRAVRLPPRFLFTNSGRWQGRPSFLRRALPPGTELARLPSASWGPSLILECCPRAIARLPHPALSRPSLLRSVRRWQGGYS